MRRFRGVVLAAVLAGLGAVLWIAAQPGPVSGTPLETSLGFTGPVRRLVNIQTQEGGWTEAGTTTTRSVTDIARDGRSATVSTTHEYRTRDGKVSVSRSSSRYWLSGPDDRPVLKVDWESGTAQSEETVFYQGRCSVKSVTQHLDPHDRFTSIVSQTCDPHGRLLTGTMQNDGTVMNRSTQRWMGGRVSFGSVWNAGLERQPATTHWFLTLSDQQGNGQMFSPVANMTTRHRSDPRGNWVWRKSEMTPVPASGNQIDTREIAYWDAADLSGQRER